MGRYANSIRSSSSGSYSRTGEGYYDGVVVARFAEHSLGGPHASDKHTRKMGQGNRHHSSGTSVSPPDSLGQPCPPPPAPGMIWPGGFGPGGQDFVQLSPKHWRCGTAATAAARTD